MWRPSERLTVVLYTATVPWKAKARGGRVESTDTAASPAVAKPRRPVPATSGNMDLKPLNLVCISACSYSHSILSLSFLHVLAAWKGASTTYTTGTLHVDDTSTCLRTSIVPRPDLLQDYPVSGGSMLQLCPLRAIGSPTV